MVHFIQRCQTTRKRPTCPKPFLHDTPPTKAKELHATEHTISIFFLLSLPLKAATYAGKHHQPYVETSPQSCWSLYIQNNFLEYSHNAHIVRASPRPPNRASHGRQTPYPDPPLGSVKSHLNSFVLWPSSTAPPSLQVQPNAGLLQTVTDAHSSNPQASSSPASPHLGIGVTSTHRVLSWVVLGYGSG